MLEAVFGERGEGGGRGEWGEGGGCSRSPPLQTRSTWSPAALGQASRLGVHLGHAGPARDPSFLDDRQNLDHESDSFASRLGMARKPDHSGSFRESGVDGREGPRGGRESDFAGGSDFTEIAWKEVTEARKEGDDAMREAAARGVNPGP